MLKSTVIAASVAGIVLAASPTDTSGYAPIHGLKLYYEIHGSGAPLILLHGALGATGMFAEIVPALSKNHRVIAVDLQGHSRTADIDRALSLETMADDVAALIAHLGIGKADVMGFSMGGLVAVPTAIQHPEVVNRLVVVSSACKLSGWYPEIVAGMAQMSAAAAEPMKQTPMYQMYAGVAPKPADWPVLLTKMGDLLREDYDWSKEIPSIQAPTLLVFGDADAVRTVHAVQFFELFGGGAKDGGWDGSGISNARLAILPGVTHYTIFSSPALASTVTPFLEESINTKEKEK